MTRTELNELIIELSSQLTSYAKSLSETYADDIMQDSIEHALTKTPMHDAHSYIRSWLMTLMKNASVKYVKYDNIYSEDITDDLIITDGFDVDFERLHVLLRNNVTSQQYITFVNSFNGYQYNEIAENLNIPINTVKSRILTVRRKMQQILVA